MSFSRWANGGIYLFDHVDYGPVCWNCTLKLDDDRDFFSTDDLDTMLDHVAAHRATGEQIADWVEQVLRDEWEAE